MHDDPVIQRLKAGIQRRRVMPAEVWFQDLIRRGVINENGEVLLRMPHAPKESEEPVHPAPPCPSAKEGTDGQNRKR